MEEQVIWKGHPSPAHAAPALLKALVASIIALAIAIAVLSFTSLSTLVVLLTLSGLELVLLLFVLWHLLKLQFITYEVTTERIRVTSGVLTSVTEATELYRVLDYMIVQSILQRLLKVATIRLIVVDKIGAQLDLHSVPNAQGLVDEIRANVERLRLEKGVRIYENPAGERPRLP